MAKLTIRQWNKLKKRRDAGESTTELAKEYGITRDAIYKKLGEPSSEVKQVANHILEASQTLHKTLQIYTPAIQESGWDMVADMIEISKHSFAGAKYSAMTFHRFAGIANQQAQKIDDANQLTEEALITKAGADAYQDSANNAFKSVANLIAANKAAIEKANDNLHAGNEPISINDFYAD